MTGNIASTMPREQQVKLYFAHKKNKWHKSWYHILKDTNETNLTAYCIKCKQIVPIKHGKSTNGDENLNIWLCANPYKQTKTHKEPIKAQTPTHQHRLSAINAPARTAICLECGPIDITSHGDQWVCGFKNRLDRRVYYSKKTTTNTTISTARL